eukprot:scaffold82619_cov60-Phaeocystis_antarctica.AAC.2
MRAQQLFQTNGRGRCRRRRRGRRLAVWVRVPSRMWRRERGALPREPLREPRLLELLGTLLLDAAPPLARLEPLRP